MTKKLFLLTVLWHLTFTGTMAQVTNSSYTTRLHEKVLQLSIIVPMNIQSVWNLFTTEEGLEKWIAPVVKIDMRAGGTIRTNYDKNKTAEDSTSIVLGIINYLEYNLITLKVNLNNNFPEQARNEDQNLQEIIQFEDLGDGKTKIISSMVGWGQGSHWDKTYDFFEKGNTWTYQEILKLFK